jgi:hypothetical protein
MSLGNRIKNNKHRLLSAFMLLALASVNLPFNIIVVSMTISMFKKLKSPHSKQPIEIATVENLSTTAATQITQPPPGWGAGEN